jgi:Flp pilus assembly protein TadG
MCAVRVRTGKQRIVLATRRLADDGGTSVVEFALIAPVLVLLLLGTVDIGTAIYDRFALNSAVSVAEQYAIVKASSVSAPGGPGLAQSLASIVGNANSVDSANAVITVNNGPTAAITAGTLTTGGTASSADLCYCPTPASGGGVSSWGLSVTCGSACSGGGVAGKFVTIEASTQFTSMFGARSLIPSQTSTTTSVVQAQ